MVSEGGGAPQDQDQSNVNPADQKNVNFSLSSLFLFSDDDPPTSRGSFLVGLTPVVNLIKLI